ncbi:uncharacterized protein LOC123877482 [Maniola jurtina]|uniref:uncharacterized protein LOC123877482 n=1 Tax=Maniola jurtina TaxID=191418 RepID=UPI001E687C84|nr:uncharacterized protein LOC123877482 [Maniola jurtina]XP_045780235.1 uncharacterized protein LOC123877482 [Maniola jurtina]XP_045780236.1 uncharacterized protein LOC123877482 [Maniola jurtina]XP_045780237.1 uncharacterized protein LOC123877482 [Maniola jurtina]
MALKVEDLKISDVVKLLEFWGMAEFVEFVKEKDINGLKLLETSEGLVNTWRPNANAKKLIQFIQEIKQNPQKYLSCIDDVITIKETNLCSDSQYQTVSIRKISQQENTNNRVEEILKKITAPKSFLYRHQTKRQKRSVTSYVPMNVNTEKKPKNFFRLSSYDYPIFDLKKRFSKIENCTDRGYYPVNKVPKEVRPKYKSMNSAEEFTDKLPEDHFYEDLCYNDLKEDNNTKAFNPQSNQVKPCMVKIQELFQSFKLPFFKKAEEEVVQKSQDIQDAGREKDANIYENSVNMYDSIHVATEQDVNTLKKEDTHAGLAVEEYLVPVQVEKDYCDVCLKQKDDSLLGYIMNYFESRFGIRRETNDAAQSEESETEPSCEREWERKINMAARPLPVPVENEPYYMNIDRTEAENLLTGQPDGTYILRPSSQPNHAYTLSVACANSVHNVGVRRRPDGRLALGFARRGERSFTSVTSLLRHHKKRRLLLVAAGGLIGATTLNETPQYYQTPSNIPIL